MAPPGAWIGWRVAGFSLLHVAVVLVFLKGFLLTRVELPDVADCEQPGLPGSCDGAPAYSKAVVLIVDALRHDFLCGRAGAGPNSQAGMLPATLGRIAASVRRGSAEAHQAHGRLAPRRTGRVSGSPHAPAAANDGAAAVLAAGRRGRKLALCRRHAHHHHEPAQGAADGECWQPAARTRSSRCLVARCRLCGWHARAGRAADVPGRGAELLSVRAERRQPAAPAQGAGQAAGAWCIACCRWRAP